VVVALMGLPGSGKTTLAEALAPRIPARTVSRDAVRAAMFRPCSFSDAEKAAAFTAVLQAIAVNCQLGHSTVVDGMPFSRAGEFEAVSRASGEHGCRAIPVLCSVSVDEARRRVRRQRDASEPVPEDRDDDLVLDVAKRFRPLPEGTIVIDTTRPPDELAQAGLARIREPREAGARPHQAPW
jgi:predicted kinase